MESLVSYNQINSGSAITGGFDAGADTFFEKARGNIVANTHGEFALGGSRSIAVRDGGGYKDAPEFCDFILTDAKYSGCTFVAVVETRVTDSGITLTPKIRKVSGTPSDAVVGSASNSISGDDDGELWAEQVLSFTPTVGERYRLMAVKSADTADGFVVGKIRRTGT
jgi:hypothetical protein